MTRFLKSLRARFTGISVLETHMAVHSLSNAEFTDRGMKRTDVARLMMQNSTW